MNGTLCMVPPHGDMTATDFVDTAPDLAAIQNLVGSTYLDIGLGISTIEYAGQIVPSAAAADATGGANGLDQNEAAMRLLKVAQMRAGQMTADSIPRTLWGNVVIGFGDDEFMAALRAAFPQPTMTP
jgi:hypothetical protein